MDEYLGVAPDDERSLYGWVKQAALNPLAIPQPHVVTLLGNTANTTAACRAYHEAVVATSSLIWRCWGWDPTVT